MTAERRAELDLMDELATAYVALRKILAEGTREHWTDEGKLEKTYSPEAQIAKDALEGK